MPQDVDPSSLQGRCGIDALERSWSDWRGIWAHQAPSLRGSTQSPESMPLLYLTFSAAFSCSSMTLGIEPPQALLQDSGYGDTPYRKCADFSRNYA